MEIPIIRDIAIIFGLSMVVLFVSHRFKIPTIVGFLLTGVLVGPYGLGLIHELHNVEVLAEVGVILLLFTIGIEFSFEELSRIKKTVIVGGSLQVGLTIAAVLGAAMLFGMEAQQAAFLGFLVALSSTAIVLKRLQETGEIDSPHGQGALGILIFQDIVIVPLMLLTPILAGATDDVGGALLLLLLKGVLIVALVIIGARYIMPRVLHQIARTRSRELFLLSVCAIGLMVAWGTNALGLSLGLGAFLAGLIISESEYSVEALGGVLPFRDVFTSFFFVSIGMLFNIGVLLQEPLYIFALTLGVILLKLAIIFVVAWLLKLQLRTALMLGFALCQIGEFSFVLSKVGLTYELLTLAQHQQFLAVSVLTMAAAPLLIALSPAIAARFVELPLPRSRADEISSMPRKENGKGENVFDAKHLDNHLIVIGFGVSGRLLVRAARSRSIPYVVVDMNPDTVKQERAKGEPIIYGDASGSELLEHIHIGEARVVVVAISDPEAVRRITLQVKKLNPAVYLIVRTRYVYEVDPLYRLGADEVIPAEFETAVEIFSRVLVQYLIPQDEIERFVHETRSDGYRMFRPLSKSTPNMEDLSAHLPSVEIRSIRIEEGAAAVQKTLLETGLRKNYGVTLLALSRKGELLPNPDGKTTLMAGDIAVLMGTAQQLANGARPLRAEPKSEPAPEK